jgi:nitrogen fixation NifU-like protein
MDFDRMVEELQREIVEREEALYSDAVLREARAPKSVGRMPDADLHGMVRGWCGDTMEIYLRLDERATQSPTIEEATFVTDGCGATVACGSMLTQMVTGATLERAEWILPKDLVNALGGLPEDSMHCAGLAISTLQNALFNWRMNTVEEEEEAD